MSDQNFQQRQDRQLVVGIAGRIGAGKTSVGKYLESQYGFFYIRYSQVLSDWQAKNPESKAHLQVVGWEVMAGGMQVELNRRLIARIESQPRSTVDGLRHPIDYESLSTTFSSGFTLLYIDCPEETRWKRLQKRYPKLENFRSADSHPVEQQIESLRGSAFAILDNCGSLDSLYVKVDILLGEIRSGDKS